MAKRIRGEVSKPTCKLSEGLSLVSRGEEMRVSYADGCRHITRNASRESNPAALNKRALKVRQLMCSGKEVEWNSRRDSRNLSVINVPQALQLVLRTFQKQENDIQTANGNVTQSGNAMPAGHGK